MQMEIVTLADYTTFRMGGRARLFSLSNREEVEEFFKENYEYVLIGSGSNILVDTKEFTIPFAKISASNITREKEGEREKESEGEGEDGDFCYLRVEAGKNWDEFVSYTVDKGLFGLELLSYVPGTVGASPVQNVGAYGTEVKDILVAVTVYDVKNKAWRVFSNSECEFAYRKSIFQEHKEYIIYDTLWKLSKVKKENEREMYPSLALYMKEHHLEASLSSIRDAVIAVRRSKLPEIKEIPSVGSFFKNPVVSNELAESLKIEFKDMVIFPVNASSVKLPAGFMIEHSCQEIFTYKNLALYEKNKLVMIHTTGLATLAEVNEYTKLIQKKVQEVFGIEIQREPEIIV